MPNVKQFAVKTIGKNKGEKFPIINGNIIYNGTPLDVSEGVSKGYLQIMPDTEDIEMAPSSSSTATDYSSSRREEAPPMNLFGKTGDPAVNSAGFLAFPLASATSDIGDALPEGKTKILVKDYGVPAAAAGDVGLNYLTATGIGAAPKAASVAVGGGVRGALKIIPNLMRKAGEHISTKTLSEIGNVTGKGAAKMATKSAAAKEMNLVARQAQLSEAIKFNKIKANKIASKGDAATAAEKAQFRELEQERAILNREYSRISSKADEAGQQINKSLFVNLSDVAQYSPFFPELGSAAGSVGQRIAIIYGGKNLAEDWMLDE